MFNKLSDIITKYSWAVIALWVILFVISLPLTGVFMQNLEYDTQNFIPRDLGAFVAQDKYDEVFPSEAKNNILVVIESDNKSATIPFIDDLNATIMGDASIKNVTGTSSIYDIHREALVNMTPELYDAMFELYDNASDLNYELYNATDTVRNNNRDLYYLKDNVSSANYELRKAVQQAIASSAKMYEARDQIVMAHSGLYQMKGVADILFGVPLYYANAWSAAQQSNSSLNDTTLNSIAYQNTADYINNAMQDQSQRDMALGYLGAFNAEWANHAGTADPYARAQETISAAAPGFISGMPQDQQPMMMDFVQNFDLARYQDQQELASFIVGRAMAAQGLTSDDDRQRLMAIYNLGQNPSEGAIDGFVINMITAGMSDSESKAARDLYALGRSPSKDRAGSYIVDQAVKDLDEDAAEVVRDAWALGEFVTSEDYDKYVIKKVCKGLNDTEQEAVRDIFAMGQDPEDEVISDYVLNEALEDLNDTEREFVLDIYGLGRNATNETLKDYVAFKIADEINITGNTTYFKALLDLGRGKTGPELEGFASDWVMSHGYDDPQIFPDSIVNTLASGSITLYIITTSDLDDAASSIEAVKIIRGHISGMLQDGKYPDVMAYVTGTSAMSMDTESASMADVDRIDKVTIVLILLLLGIYFRSFLTPFVPLILIGTAIVAAFGVMGVLSTGFQFYYLVMTFMLVIMLGAGTDYCVFMLSRYAEERSKGSEIADSVKAAVRNAGKSIASSGTTAMIGFGALILVDQGVFRSVGVGTAVGIMLSMLVALTLVPAVLMVVGDRLFWPRKIYNSGTTGFTTGLWSKITRAVIKNSKVILLIALLLTIPAIMIYSQLTLGMDFISMMPGGIESKVGYDLINDEFGSGAFEKAMIVVTLPYNLTDSSGNYTSGALGQIEDISATIAGISGVEKVYSMTRPDGSTIDYNDLESYPDIEEEFYKSYMEDNTGMDGKTTVIYVSFEGSPFAEGARKTTESIQSKLTEYENGPGSGVSLLLGGASIGMFEYQKICTDNYGIVIPVVLIGIFFVLVALLRSVFTPARLVVTLLMSIFWTLAAFIIVFQFWMGASIIWLLPIMLFCVLMGLGVDYDIFLVSRIREEVLNGKSEEEAITHAVEATGTIITLCGAVMASAFGSMLLSDMLELKEFGFVLCLAIILDATVMRLVVVPAVMVLMKKYNWWMPFSKEKTEK
ncbi:multidrug RND transporter [Methanocella sp. CWC-04]|uniref:Multidrug RND transporter n=1 Tax=Methanooceanicella nereidis TaxID=2052831 RepID=A0AAP2RGG1_9EURY|nr:MMPL family transporter [Methanocella sp. CWC-04]MCD1296346.1 multidrug RND transporter [Methanocella sp. CWC-04]